MMQRMVIERMKRATVFVLACALPAAAPAQKQIPVRQLTTIDAAASEPVGFLNGVRELSDGRVLVNDAGKRRLIIFDKTLSTMQIIADTTSGRRNQYGARTSAII